MCDTTPKDCRCRAAVLKAYNELHGEHALPACFALEAACIVYHHHHPEDPQHIAKLKVESWIHAGHLH